MKRKCTEGKRDEEKVSDEQKQDEEEDEEEKMKAFYTLVRNVRDVHNQMLSGSSGNPQERNKQEVMKLPTWTPTFTWEDFAGDAQLRDKFVILPSSSSSKNEEKQPDEAKKTRDFDLNLSL